VSWFVLCPVAVMASGGEPVYAPWRTLEQLDSGDDTYPFVLPTPNGLLVYVAEIDPVSGWPTDRLYVLDFVTGEYRTDADLYYVAVSPSREWYAVGRSVEPGSIDELDTLVIADAGYARFRYTRGELEEPIEISVVEVAGIQAGDVIASWFPAGGYFRWQGDSMLVTCTGNWEVLSDEGFAAAGFWRGIGGRTFDLSFPVKAPMVDTSWFARFPQRPWRDVYADDSAGWPTEAGKFVTEATDDGGGGYWRSAQVVRTVRSQRSVVMPGRLIAVDRSGANLVIELVEDKVRKLVWYRRGATGRR
jgi:hypothetical protein